MLVLLLIEVEGMYIVMYISWLESSFFHGASRKKASREVEQGRDS